MIRLVISIGSNLCDGVERVEAAIEWLCGVLSACEVSNIYSTVACNGIGADYFNTVLMGDYDGEQSTISSMIKTYEIEAGRVKGDKQAVAIDVDVVMCDGEVLREWDYNQRYFKIGYMAINNK